MGKFTQELSLTRLQAIPGKAGRFILRPYGVGVRARLHADFPRETNMKEDAKEMPSIRWIFSGLAIALAWSGVLVPGMASAQEEAGPDESAAIAAAESDGADAPSGDIGIDRLNLSATMGASGVSSVDFRHLDYIDQFAESYAPTVRAKGETRQLTAQQEMEIIALVAPFRDVIGNNKYAAGNKIKGNVLTLEADLSSYGMTSATINMNARRRDIGNVKAGIPFRLHNIVIESGEGALDPKIAALLEGLIPYLKSPTDCGGPDRDADSEASIADRMSGFTSQIKSTGDLLSQECVD